MKHTTSSLKLGRFCNVSQLLTLSFQRQIIIDFKNSISKSVELLGQNLDGMEVFSLSSNLYFNELIQRIKN